mmetsp:Transcript_17617/g.52918  ORF Transcript_17617/g.52918 Transcript_17617/m.52918 type:complete len:554 (-) Transcript_17617:904-2565(-)
MVAFSHLARQMFSNVTLVAAGGTVPHTGLNSREQLQVPGALLAEVGATLRVSKGGGGGGGGGGGKGGGAASAVTARSVDFSKWYLDVVREAELADYGPVRGTMVIRPYGFALWESIQTYLNGRFRECGAQNCYFPQLIPLSFLQKEAEHVEGFAPELALVTKGGGKDLDEPLVVRPTSESIVNHMLSQWVRSYRDLPMRLNQWANVHRWEMRTRPFLRTLEFLWQEGHTAHATGKEAQAEAKKMLGVYADLAISLVGLPVIAGRKSRIESFAGAVETYTIEGMMGDGKALQSGTTHYLGDNFARAFNTQYLDENGELMHVHQSSWGLSTRMVGAVIMAHGDDAGLRLPPLMAPIQVVIVPIVKKGMEEDAAKVAAAVEGLRAAAQGAGLRVHVDDTEGRSPGWKFNFWEMKGVPVRVEVGPKDVAGNTCVVSRRDRPGKEGKQFGIPLEAAPFVAHVTGLLDEVQDSLLKQATEFRDVNIVDVTTFDELKAAVAAGKWARGPWAGSDDDERAVKEQTQATLRCLPFDQPASPGPCFYTGAETGTEIAIFAKAY